MGTPAHTLDTPQPMAGGDRGQTPAEPNCGTPHTGPELALESKQARAPRVLSLITALHPGAV